MVAYFVLQIEWTDEAGYRAYFEGLGEMIEEHHGRFVISSPQFQVAEGTWKPGRLVVIEFPTLKDLREWYDSPAYQPLRELRLRSSRSDAVIVEGT